MLPKAHKQSKVGRSRQAVTLEKHLRVRGRVVWSVGAAVTVIVLLASGADHRGWLTGWANGLGRYEGRMFRVLGVVEGDRIVVAPMSNLSEPVEVQLWGIDAAGPSDGPARQRTAQWCRDQVVKLHIQAHRLRDDGDRLLAYVRLPDGSLLNERLLASGLVRVDERFSHRAQNRFRMLQQQAKVDRAGLWSPRRLSEQAQQ